MRNNFLIFQFIINTIPQNSSAWPFKSNWTLRSSSRCTLEYLHSNLEALWWWKRHTHFEYSIYSFPTASLYSYYQVAYWFGARHRRFVTKYFRSCPPHNTFLHRFVSVSFCSPAIALPTLSWFHKYPREFDCIIALVSTSSRESCTQTRVNKIHLFNLSEWIHLISCWHMQKPSTCFEICNVILLQKD